MDLKGFLMGLSCMQLSNHLASLMTAHPGFGDMKTLKQGQQQKYPGTKEAECFVMIKPLLYGQSAKFYGT